MEQRNENKTELKMIKMSDVQSQTVDWLWYPFIPYGKLTIIQGDPGDGKTTLILNIAARLSKGEYLCRLCRHYSQRIYSHCPYAAGIVNVAAGCHYPFCTSSLRMWLLRSVSHDKGIQTLFRLHPCRVSFCLRSLFRLFFRTLKMSLFSYQASSCCPTFAVSLQRLSSNDKKETK